MTAFLIGDVRRVLRATFRELAALLITRPGRIPCPSNPLFEGNVCRLAWWIRAMRLIGGTGMHRINHEASIHHAKRRIPADKRYGGVMAVTS